MGIKCYYLSINRRRDRFLDGEDTKEGHVLHPVERDELA